jgi:hypothetical protein
MKTKWGIFVLITAVVTAVGMYQKYKPCKTALMAGSVGHMVVKRLGRQLCIRAIGKGLLAVLLAVGGQKICEKTLTNT